DEVVESPTKRALPAGEVHAADRPVTGSELRQLLQLHASEMKEAWRTFESRLDKAEHAQQKQVGEIASLSGRVKINEKDIRDVKKQQETLQPKLDSLTEDVRNLKVQLDEVKNQPIPGARGGDPAQALARQGGGAGDSAVPVTDNHPGTNSGGDVLSEEDQRTLIMEGWLQDTRRAMIETEADIVFKLPELEGLFDVDKIAVFGPRRSVGMVKFVVRNGETIGQMRERMWKVIRTVSQAKLMFPSTKNMGEEKQVWMSFMKTRTARTRTALISMVRRVTIGLAMDAKDEGGGVVHMEHTQMSAYDMDWSAGTIWCGVHKIASATHRGPKDAEVITMHGGWVNLDAVGQ
ncbi:GIP, partial [Symbiodinium necroappetens]